MGRHSRSRDRRSRHTRDRDRSRRHRHRSRYVQFVFYDFIILTVVIDQVLAHQMLLLQEIH